MSPRATPPPAARRVVPSIEIQRLIQVRSPIPDSHPISTLPFRLQAPSCNPPMAMGLSILRPFSRKLGWARKSSI